MLSREYRKTDRKYKSLETGDSFLDAQRSILSDFLKRGISGFDRTIRNATVGHSSPVPVEDRYIHLTDERLLEAGDNMRFDYSSNMAQVGELSRVTKE